MTFFPTLNLIRQSGTVVLLAGVLAAAASTAHTPAAENRRAWTIDDARQTVRDLAKIEDPNEFAAGYLQLVARHHVTPLIRKGNRIPIALGAWIDITNPQQVRLGEPQRGAQVQPQAEFIRGLTGQGRWTKVDAQPLTQLRAVVIRTVNLLVVIDLTQGQISPIALPSNERPL